MICNTNNTSIIFNSANKVQVKPASRFTEDNGDIIWMKPT